MWKDSAVHLYHRHWIEECASYDSYGKKGDWGREESLGLTDYISRPWRLRALPINGDRWNEKGLKG